MTNAKLMADDFSALPLGTVVEVVWTTNTKCSARVRGGGVGSPRSFYAAVDRGGWVKQEDGSWLRA